MMNEIEDYRKLSTSGESLYSILGIQKSSTVREIKEAYKKLKLELRSNKNVKTVEEGAKKMNDVNRAHSVLSDTKKKGIYDSNGSLGLYLVERYVEGDGNSCCVVSSGWCVTVSLLCGAILYGLLSCFCCCCCCCDTGCDRWRSSPGPGRESMVMSANTTVPLTEEEKKQRIQGSKT